MANRHWLDEVQERLVKQNLPPSYVQRLIGELGDHLEDLKEENVEVDAISRLGEPDQVANSAVGAYRRRSFIGRHPTAAFVVFAISPVVPLYLVFLVGAMAIMMLRADRTLDWHENHWILSPLIVVCSTFVSVLYGELAMRLGIGVKWILASCAVLGAFAMLMEFALGVTLMVLAQFAVPFAVGWWFAKQKHNASYPATRFLIFAISPVALYSVLWLVAALAIGATSRPYVSVLLYVVPTAVASFLYWNVAKQFGLGRKWMVISCFVLATLVAMPFMPVLIMYVFPTAVASVLYCKLGGRSGIDQKWMLVSCAVLAVCVPLQNLLIGSGFEYYTASGTYHSLVGLWVCSILVQFVVPLAIGWGFMRRMHGQGDLQLAS